MKLAIILGTRPETIKLAPLILACKERHIPYIILHTGQHYSYNMDQLFFEELALPKPDYHLHLSLTSGGQGEQVGKMLIGIEEILQKEKPSAILVQGDTNSVLAGALAAAKLQIPIAHVEAGLRSYDRSMPEELNRIITDHLSTYLFVPTPLARDIALKEGITKTSIILTGNTVVDAITLYKEKALQSTFLKTYKLKKQEYILVTAHRAENVDHADKLQNIFTGLQRLAQETQLPLIYPLHPRTKKFMTAYNIQAPKEVQVIDPIGFFDFLQAEMFARLVLTDSGGVQEETCILGIPCVTLRENTERPETLTVGSNVLAGTNPEKILSCSLAMLAKKPTWKQPFGDGKAGHHMLDYLQSALK